MIKLPFCARLQGLHADVEITEFYHHLVAQLRYMHLIHLAEDEINIVP